MNTIYIALGLLVAVVVGLVSFSVASYNPWTCAPMVRAVGIGPTGGAGELQCELQKYDFSSLPPSELYALGNDYLGQGKPDISLVFWEEAWRKNHGPSARAIGEMLDPNIWGTQPSAFTKPSVDDARKWYQRAVGEGDIDAAAALAALP